MYTTAGLLLHGYLLNDPVNSWAVGMMQRLAVELCPRRCPVILVGGGWCLQLCPWRGVVWVWCTAVVSGFMAPCNQGPNGWRLWSDMPYETQCVCCCSHPW
jgi:hypothetical protein